MKLKTRIILGFTMIILMPLLLFAATLYGFSQSQSQKAQAVTEGDGTVYDISITDSADSQGRVHVMAKDLSCCRWCGHSGPFLRGVCHAIHDSLYISFHCCDRSFQIMGNVADQLSVLFLFQNRYQPHSLHLQQTKCGRLF